MCCDFFAERKQAGVLGVEGVTGIHRFDGGLLDEIRRGLIRFAEIQPQNAIHAECDLSQFADTGVRNGMN